MRTENFRLAGIVLGDADPVDGDNKRAKDSANLAIFCAPETPIAD